MKLFTTLLLAATLLLIGCKKDPVNTNSSASVPTFTLGYNVYPSSIAFDVAQDHGFISADKTKLGTIEKKWGVKINLKQADYDTLLTMYGNGQADAVTVVAFDTLAPSFSRPAVNFIPVSTSKGGDGCVVVAGIKSVDDLKGKPTYGLEKSVSNYLFWRYLKQQGKNPADFPFKNMDPDSAAQAIQTNQKDINSAVIWNPGLLQTIRTRQGSKVLFDSTVIPGEIVDVVVAGKDVLSKPGGENFLCAVIDCYYEVCKLTGQDKVIEEFGTKNSKLNLADMKTILTQTVFYKTSDEAITLFNSDQFRKGLVEIIAFQREVGSLEKQPYFGFNDETAQVNFTTKYIKMVASKK